MCIIICCYLAMAEAGGLPHTPVALAFCTLLRVVEGDLLRMEGDLLRVEGDVESGGNSSNDSRRTTGSISAAVLLFLFCCCCWLAFARLKSSIVRNCERSF
jgi:hypothetical protein